MIHQHALGLTGAAARDIRGHRRGHLKPITTWNSHSAAAKPQVGSAEHFPCPCDTENARSFYLTPFLEAFQCLVVQAVTTWQKCVPKLQQVFLEVPKSLHVLILLHGLHLNP